MKIETPDSWIERQEEYAPTEGAIWCSDCGEWIEEACEHYPNDEPQVPASCDEWLKESTPEIQ